MSDRRSRERRGRGGGRESGGVRRARSRGSRDARRETCWHLPRRGDLSKARPRRARPRGSRARERPPSCGRRARQRRTGSHAGPSLCPREAGTAGGASFSCVWVVSASFAEKVWPVARSLETPLSKLEFSGKISHDILGASSSWLERRTQER